MKKIIFIFTVLFISIASFGQSTGSFNPVFGKQDFKDSLIFSKFLNSVGEDSVLTIDRVTKKLKFVLKGGGSSGGVDSCTSALNGFYYWKSGIPTLVITPNNVYSFILNYDSTYQLIYRNSVLEDSISLGVKSLYPEIGSSITIRGNGDSVFIGDSGTDSFAYRSDLRVWAADSTYYVDCSLKQCDTIYWSGSGGGSIIDTTNKWVQDVYQRGDSIFKFKGGIETFIGQGGGAASLSIGYGLDTLSGGVLIADTTTTNGLASKQRLTASLALKENVITAPNSIKRYLNGYKQFVSFLTDSITEGTLNLYYTDARARAAISLTGSGGSYNSTTGVITLTGSASTGQWLTVTDTNRIYRANGWVGIGDTARSLLTLFPRNTGTVSTTPSDSDSSSLFIFNKRVAAAGSPLSHVIWSSLVQAWKTNATAASQNTQLRMVHTGVQGTSAPTSTLTIESSINGSSYSPLWTFLSSGALSGAGLITANSGFSTNGNFSGAALAANAASTITLATMTTTPTSGLSLNTAVTTVGVPVRYSSAYAMEAHVWNTTTSADNIAAARWYVKPVSGATPTASLFLQTYLAASPAYTDVLEIKQNGSLIMSNVVRKKSYTVATLPTGTLGDEACVTDAVLPVYLGALTGGGSVVCPVFFNGSIWVSH